MLIAMLRHILALLLVIAAAAGGGGAVPLSGVADYLAAVYRTDPLAADDPLPSFPSNLKHLLATDPPAPIPAVISALLDLRLPVPVHLKLAGAAAFSAADPALLLTLTSAALSSAPFHSLSSPYPLSLSHSLHLHPALSPHLASAVSAALASHLASATPTYPSPHALHPVPFSAVDNIIHNTYIKDSASDAAPGFYIYIVAPEKQSKLYGYSYDNQTKCLGSIWTAAERYMWIDLGAGPVDYGPALSGEGALPRGDFHPLAALRRSGLHADFLADVASLVLSAYRSLLVPPLRNPVFYESSLVIQFIHIHGTNARDTIGLDFGTIERVVKDSELGFGRQKLDFEHYSLKYSECPSCSFAVSRAMKSFTTRYLFDNYTLISSEYLDSKVLYGVLVDAVDELRRIGGMKEREDQLSRKILPVYVFDLEYDKLLMLDRHHQAVAFPDMVITVRTRSPQTPSDYTCNSRHVLTPTRNLERPIVGALLQSMWGVAPTHLSWSPQHNSTLVDYTWSVGQTPFGPFLASPSLSFVQKDAAHRNVLLTGLNYTVTGLIDVLHYVAAHGGDRKLLWGLQHLEYTRRWNLIELKLEKFISAMSQLDYDKALYYLRSSDHDLYALHDIVYKATRDLEASLICFKDPGFPWATALMACVFLLALFYVYVKRGKIFKSKRKQF